MIEMINDIITDCMIQWLMDVTRQIWTVLSVGYWALAGGEDCEKKLF